MKSVSLTEEDKALAALRANSTEGDLNKLDFRPRISLALILDPLNEGCDWKALAKCLSLSHLEAGLGEMTSPTKELLTMYEVSPSLPFTHLLVIGCDRHAMGPLLNSARHSWISIVVMLSI